MIETKRLRLRRVRISDHAAFDSLFSDEEVMESSDDGPLDSKEVGVWMNRQIDVYEKSNGVEMLAVEMKSTSEVIGYCGLTQFRDIDGLPEVEVGYRLIRKFWGYGYATEAAGAVRDYAFSALNLPRLVALIEPVNERSIRVARKLGMSCEKEVMMEGYDHPDHLYTIDNQRTHITGRVNV